MDSAHKIERGLTAKALLENSLLRETLDKLEARYVEAWKASNAVELREDAHKYIRLLEWLKADIQSVANTGEIEDRRVRALRGDPMPLSEFKAWQTK